MRKVMRSKQVAVQARMRGETPIQRKGRGGPQMKSKMPELWGKFG